LAFALACSHDCSSWVSAFLRASFADLSSRPPTDLATAAVIFSMPTKTSASCVEQRRSSVSFLGLEAAVDQAAVFGGEFGEAGLDAVVIGEDQALRGHEGGRAVRQPDGGEAYVIQPFRSHRRAVSLLNFARGEKLSKVHMPSSASAGRDAASPTINNMIRMPAP